VHCDLKGASCSPVSRALARPELTFSLDAAANILGTKNGNIKLSDFGVSLNLHAIKATRGFNTSTKEANGTPNWSASSSRSRSHLGRA